MFKKLINKVRTSISGSTVSTPALVSEDEYYKELFTKSEDWSNPTPNSEERLRWKIIENFIYYVKGYAAGNELPKFTILDLGCGRGWLANLMSAHGIVKGIEPVIPVVNYANKLFPHLDITPGTAKDLITDANNKFQLIVSSEVIEHVPDTQKPFFVKDIYNLLHDNGFVIITTPRKEAQTKWMKYATPDQPVEEWMSEKMVEELFVNNGFEKHLIERFSISPQANEPEIEIYQLWLFQKKES